MNQTKQKPPITYYGGKQKLCSKIIPLIPPYVLYGEPFGGGLAVFFNKEPSEVEVINDTNSELINFFRVIQTDYNRLEKEIQTTLHSRRLHSDARVIYTNPHLFNDIQRAWAVWVLANESFCSKLDGAWGYDVKRNETTKKINGKKDLFTKEMAQRLQNVQIECTDALRIITSRDREESFFYCDPPYFNSDCGHYDGYTEKDFEELLKTLSAIKGKFILSSYPSEILKKYVEENRWSQKIFEQKTSVNRGYTGKTKQEVLTANFEINK
jgi:DNA adenine methylase